MGIWRLPKVPAAFITFYLNLDSAFDILDSRIIVLVAMNGFCAHYELLVGQGLLLVLFIFSALPASSLCEMTFWSLIKLSMNRTNYANGHPVSLVINKRIVILVTMHLSCIRNKLFGSFLLHNFLNFNKLSTWLKREGELRNPLSAGSYSCLSLGCKGINNILNHKTFCDIFCGAYFFMVSSALVFCPVFCYVVAKRNNMNNCKEFALDDVLAVIAIPVDDFNLGTAAWQLSKTIDSRYFTPTLTHSITIGLKAATEGGTLIPIMRATGKAKDDTQDSVSGRLHTVKVSCEVDDRDAAVWSDLLTLERTPSHLLLTFRDKTQAFVQGTIDTYQCQVERDGAKTSVSLRIQCLMGLQLIV